MAQKLEKSLHCHICSQTKGVGEMVPGDMIREPIAELIRKEHPDWSPDCSICIADLRRFRAKYVQMVLEAEKGEISALEEEVLTSLQRQEVLSKDIELEFETNLTFGHRLADKIAAFGGSWGFIILFAGVILAWIVINTSLALRHPFDPYPYILLNLVLSCLAAIQAPVIMMSQNRQEVRDRLRSQNDYKVNLKAELEVRQLHEKIDYLLTHQWQRLLEIQQIQMDLMEELSKQRDTRR